MTVAENHPSIKELTAFSLGKLDDRMFAAIETHVADCSSCQKQAAATLGDPLVDLLRSAFASAPQEDTVGGTEAQVPTPLPFTPLDEATTEARNGVSEAQADWVRSQADDPGPPELATHDRYRVERLLGKGGMGAVYLAEHRIMQRSVALKVIDRRRIGDPAMMERFRREVRAAARLSHPNIVTTFDAEDAGDTQFLAMEYVEGVSLGR